MARKTCSEAHYVFENTYSARRTQHLRGRTRGFDPVQVNQLGAAIIPPRHHAFVRRKWSDCMLHPHSFRLFLLSDGSFGTVSCSNLSATYGSDIGEHETDNRIQICVAYKLRITLRTSDLEPLERCLLNLQPWALISVFPKAFNTLCNPIIPNLKSEDSV